MAYHVAATFRQMSSVRLKVAHGVTSLLTPDGYNPKTRKGRARGYSSAVMHLAPASLSGRNVCAWSSPGCRAACLNTAGRGGIVNRDGSDNTIQLARVARTRWFFADRAAFLAQLLGEIETHVRRARANGMIPAVRLNGTSDIPWERVRLADGRTVLEAFPDVQFYDYTKSVARALSHASGELPGNYHLTFSRSEVNDQDARMVLAAGGNVAAVFAHGLPSAWGARPVVNGDQDDLRFLDPSGVVVGLKAKGRAAQDDTGFVIATTTARIALPMAPGGPTVALAALRRAS